MMLEEAINYQLRNYSGLNSLIGGDATRARVFPLVFPQRDPATGLLIDSASGMPLVTFSTIGGLDQHVFRDLPTLTEGHVTTTAWGDMYSDAKHVSEQVWKALYGFMGVMGGTDGVDVGAVLSERRSQDLRDPETQLFQVIQDFVVWYNPQTVS